MTSEKMSSELAIIGAGPAGIAAAVQAAQLGVDVVLFDEQAALGGQVYRNIEHNSSRNADLTNVLGQDYRKGQLLAEAFRQEKITYRPYSSVWNVKNDGDLAFTQNNKATMFNASKVIIATGAMERPVPVPGWTLPNVMSLGAVQTLIKASALVPDKPIVIAGSGPLVYLVAIQLMRLGAPLRAILNTAPPVSQSLGYFPARVSAVRQLLKGLGWIYELKRGGVKIINAEKVAAEGACALETVRYECNGRGDRLEASFLFLHEGVIPNTQLTSALRCKHVFDDEISAWKPVTDQWGKTSVSCITVAGDGAGISGAAGAPAQGRLAALNAAFELGHISAEQRDTSAKPLFQELKQQRSLRRFINHAYRPTLSVRPLEDETIVCRCEEITAGTLRDHLNAGFTKIDQLKAFSRCGMGQCQGRMCASTVANLMSQTLNTTREDIHSYRIRLPVKPVSLEQWAYLANTGIEKQSGSSEDPIGRI
ncbi:FAD/NAD(P)-dependent oxidoreductase [Pseudochrobactrum kiredjianiae]|uniref:NAD(P)/FAD-dependent oxidoreductase n=1 Tax=Pseudochrobactrum kiredjianiae TaxID=386305 RepID=A0ABW3V297_9HYPH|nr:NAD(P)/FAD-dependent oxidoreductase [Pseudochrobactrum kiredjianiae]MDM7853251.1 NAD(P)/FAD-dependent oxidoreductase [Pseudochrobactrum kiredjianiae]